MTNFDSELIEAINNSDSDGVKNAIMSGANVNSKSINYFYSQKDWTPLHYAASKGNLDIFKILVNAGASIFVITSALNDRSCYIDDYCGDMLSVRDVARNEENFLICRYIDEYEKAKNENDQLNDNIKIECDPVSGLKF